MVAQRQLSAVEAALFSAGHQLHGSEFDAKIKEMQEAAEKERRSLDDIA